MSRQNCDCQAAQLAVLPSNSHTLPKIARCVLSVTLGMLLIGSAPLFAAPLNILYYGNSFLLHTDSGDADIPTLVSKIAVAAGHEAPHFVNASHDAVGLDLHLLYNTEPITSGISAEQDWDFVVLQNYSTLPTRLGNVNQHRAETVAMYQAVAGRSPNVVPVLLETWARGYDFDEFYAGPDPVFPLGPHEMQDELHAGYALAAHDVNFAAGQSIARVAEVGTAFQNLDFNSLLYFPDAYHLSDLGNLLAALVVYTSVYGWPPIDEIDLTEIVASLGYNEEDSNYVVGGAQSVAPIPEPSTLVMALAALGIFGLWRRRQL